MVRPGTFGYFFFNELRQKRCSEICRRRLVKVFGPGAITAEVWSRA